MAGDFFASDGFAHWIVIVAAFVMGASMGWLLWGGRTARIAELETGLAKANTRLSNANLEIVNGELTDAEDAINADGVEDADGSTEPNTKDLNVKIEALEKELKNARTMLGAHTEETGAVGALVDEIDQIVKRTNGRVKMVLEAVRLSKKDKS